MYKAFGIVKSSGRNIYVDGMQDYRPIGAFLVAAWPLPVSTRNEPSWVAKWT